MFVLGGIIRPVAAFLLMRKPGGWNEPVDERILELLAVAGPMQPKTISEEFERRSGAVRYHPNTIGRRCRELEARGFLQKTGAGVYSITDRGREFLEGDLDADDLAED